MIEKREEYQTRRPMPEDMDRPGSVDIFRLLSEPMPIESLSTDDGRGFPLTSIKAAFILERLNMTFGLLGYGWRYAVGPHSLETAGGKEEILVKVAVQWRVTEGDDAIYCPPVYWQRRTHAETGQVIEGWQFPEGLRCCWSEPIFATGGSSAQRKGSVPLTDAYRAAVTNAITKIASRMGVGQEVFKGQDELVGNSARKQGAKKRQPRQSKASAPKKAPVKAKAPAKAGNGFPDLEAMRAAVKAEFDKLKYDDGDADPRTLQTLAHKMSALGVKMQPVRLIQCLMGKGGFTQKGVMSTYNFLLKGKIGQGDIELLNKAAFDKST